jgi:hypothetical protein
MIENNAMKVKRQLSHLLKEIEDDLSPDAIEAVLSHMQTLAKDKSRPGF